MTGDTLEATLETKEVEPINGRRSFVNEVRPLVDTNLATISMGRRERQSDTLDYTDDVAMTDSGRCPMRASGRYHRARLTIPAGATWSDAKGVDIRAIEGGLR